MVAKYTLTELARQRIESSKFCYEYEIIACLEQVSELHQETNNRIWGYIEIATANHDISEIAKHLNKAKILAAINNQIHSIWGGVALQEKTANRNFFKQYEKLKNQELKLINQF
jgi:hypothetical protein